MIKQSFALILLIFTTSCSRTDLVFRFADTAMVSKADDYFDLSSEQKKELSKNIQDDLEGVRKNTLPKVAQSLRGLEMHVKDDKLDEVLVQSVFDQTQSYMKSLAASFSESALKTSTTLSSKQFDHFAKTVREDIEKNREKNETSDKSLKENFRRYKRGFEFWIGSLTDEQEDALTDFLKAHPYPWQLQNQSREYVLQKFMASQKAPQDLRQFIVGYYTDYEAVRMAEFNQALNQHKASLKKFIVETLWPSLTQRQKSQLSKNLLEKATELEKIAQR